MHSDSPKKNPEEKNVGVYICHCGGNISDHVDVDQLAKNIETISMDCKEMAEEPA